MGLSLIPTREMRLDGAPAMPLPNEQEIIDSLAADILANDTDNVYGGDRNLVRAIAERRYREMVQQQQQAQRASSEAAAAQRNAGRNAQRAAVRGVDPESLPADEYGNVTGRTVREANRPPEDAERALMQDQDLADEITRGLRTGDQNWQAEGDRQYSQEYGLGGFEYGPGQTDLDIRRRIQDQQGFVRTQQGMVPAGRSPTPEQIANYRDFHYDWANETPGSERQARYNPEAYEEYREGVRTDIQDQARKDMATYGTGPASNPDLTPAQQEARANRAQSEWRVDNAQGQDWKRRVRLEEAAGVTAEQAANMTDDDLRREAYRNRQRDVAGRRDLVADRGRLRGAGLPAMITELPQGDRAEAIRGLIPDRNAAANADNAELTLRQNAIDAEREADRQRNEAFLKKMELDAQAAQAAREDEWRRWEAAQAQENARRAEEDRRWREGRDESRTNREQDLTEREKDRQAAAAREDKRDSLERDRPGLEAEAAARVAEQKAADQLKAEERQREEAMRLQRLQTDVDTYGVGVQHIMEGKYDTPAAHEALQKIARQADRSWGGFFQGDAVRMDAELYRLGVIDAATRHALVHRYGLGTAPGSNWRPSDVDGRDNVLSGLWMPLTGGVEFPQR